jgi:predicted glycosyltransferase
MPEADFSVLCSRGASTPGIEVDRFTPEFLSYLAAADLSISMAGYNTCMNILAAGTPSLVLPFDQNKEQQSRAEKLTASGRLTLLKREDLEASRLAECMEKVIAGGRDSIRIGSVNLAGAENTARLLEECCSERIGVEP